MFTNKTVFILGAGASWHYGFPTGEDLVKKVIEKATYASRYFTYFTRLAYSSNKQRPDYLADTADPNATLVEQWRTALAESEELKAGLQQVNPLVIDYFLGWNPRLRAIGRLLIAWVILECEHNAHQWKGNINRKETLTNSPFESDRFKSNNLDLKKFKDDWCRFVIHQLAINCKTSSDVLRNEVRFVTFNYDVSLEWALYQGLQHIHLFQPEDIDRFLANDRIMHVYGRVRENPTEPPPILKLSEQGRDPESLRSANERSSYETDQKAFLDQIYSASRGIRVIDPEDKEVDKDVIDAARKAIAEATRVYILGYGFDENNSERLQLSKSLRAGTGNNKSVMFTNYRNANRVNKRASKTFFGNQRKFSPNGPSVEEQPHERFSGKDIYEISVLDVYEALELDFESLD